MIAQILVICGPPDHESIVECIELPLDAHTHLRHPKRAWNRRINKYVKLLKNTYPHSKIWVQKYRIY
jgi:hypothetical protein